LVALAELLVAFIGFGVWAHHMFATGLPVGALVFFAAASMMVVIPSTIQIYAWLFTVNLGRPEFRAPLLFIGGFIALFVIGGLSGIMFAAIPFDQTTSDTYCVVAHFHFIIFGAAVFPFLGGTLEWTTSSPPPLYNFPVIPTVLSPYPNWDRADGGLRLDHGHTTPATTVRDGHFDEVLKMPSESGLPIVLAFAVTVLFIMLLTTHFVVAGIFAGIAGLVLAAWHAQEPAEQ